MTQIPDKDTKNTPLSLIDQIVSLVSDTCSPAKGTWENDLRQALVMFFDEPFRDREILTAKQLNKLQTRLKFVETVIAGHVNEPEIPPEIPPTRLIGETTDDNS